MDLRSGDAPISRDALVVATTFLTQAIVEATCRQDKVQETLEDIANRLLDEVNSPVTQRTPWGPLLKAMADGLIATEPNG